jgi:hypothetical protein
MKTTDGHRAFVNMMDKGQTLSKNGFCLNKLKERKVQQEEEREKAE